MRYKQVIWDWNGTLMNDVWLCVEVVNHLLRRRGLRQLSAHSYRAHFDFPVVRFYQWLGLEYSGDAFSAISEEFINEYDRRRFECDLQANAGAALETIAATGACQVILSAYRQHTLAEVVRHYQLEDHFEKLLGLDNFLAAGKTQLGLKHMESIACRPHEVILIGDTCHDFEVASAIGADCVLLAHGHQSRDRLLACGVPVVDSLQELLEKNFQGW